MEPEALTTMIWFTSDTHFHHARVIEYCNRPFADVEEMNEELVRRWNDRVGKGDVVYHLGDFALGPREKLAPTVARLNGAIILVRGNHDRSRSAMLSAGFPVVVPDAILVVDGATLFLHHQPILDFAKLNRADLHLCGHIHNEWARQGDIINVGVDVRDFRPQTLPELLANPA